MGEKRDKGGHREESGAEERESGERQRGRRERDGGRGQRRGVWEMGVGKVRYELPVTWIHTSFKKLQQVSGF